MNQPNSDLLLAAVLAGPNPLDCRLRPDGSMCVIDHAGRKLFFSPNRVAQAAARLAAQRAHCHFEPPSDGEKSSVANPPDTRPKPSASPKPIVSDAVVRGVAPNATPTKPTPSPTPKPKSAK